MNAVVEPVAPTVNLAEASRFLDFMAEGEAVTFQTFDDDKEREDNKLANILHGDIDECATKLQRLNARGAGVYWMVNFGDGLGRSEPNVTSVRAVFLDLDGAPLQPVLAAGVEPHSVVESSPGKWHVYWQVNGCRLDQFKPVQQALAAKFGGDTSVNDLPRVLRVPGFIHAKRDHKKGLTGEPFRSRIESLEAFQPYDLAELVQRLGLTLTAKKPPKIDPETGEISDDKPGEHVFAEAVQRLGRKLRSGDGRRAMLKTFVASRSGRGLKADDIRLLIAGIAAKYFDPDDPIDEANISEVIAHFVKKDEAKGKTDGEDVGLVDFHAHMPSHSYLFVPTRELWPASSVNGRVPWPTVDGKAVSPAGWLDKNRPVEQLAWNPAEPQLVKDRLLQRSGWVQHPGTTVFNLYRPPERAAGDASKAGPWLDHVRKVYPDEATRIIQWLAHRVQRPGEKCNHALVLGGLQGIGKDTLLEPVKAAVGGWNWSDINPAQMLGRFNEWVRAVVIRVNEARDLGDVDRFAFYDHAKNIICAPPDVLRVDEKHMREYYVVNVAGVIVTTNHASDGLYLPADDRRHYVAWSPCRREEFKADYWTRIYQWFAAGGNGHVGAYLASLDLSGFDPKAPPPKTPAFWTIVAAGEAPESGELRDVIDHLGKPAALSLLQLADRARALKMLDFADELLDRKNRRTLPHKLDRVGYVPVRNPDSEDGLFRIGNRRQAVYAQRVLSAADQIRAARRIV